MLLIAITTQRMVVYNREFRSLAAMYVDVPVGGLVHVKSSGSTMDGTEES